jgi:uncharacterized phage-like protein YoqJ
MHKPVISTVGHRFVTMPGNGQAESLHGRLEPPLLQLANEKLTQLNPCYLITGISMGFETIVTEAARARNIPYTVAMPYRGYERRLMDEARERFMALLLDAARVHYVSGAGYSERKIHRQRAWMVDNSECMLALWTGRQGSTANAVMYAWSRRKHVKNIWPEFVKLATKNLL